MTDETTAPDTGSLRSRPTLPEALRRPVPPRVVVVLALFFCVWAGVRHATFHDFWIVPGTPARTVARPSTLPPEVAYRAVVEHLSGLRVAEPSACKTALSLVPTGNPDPAWNASLLLLRATVAARCGDDVEADRAFREAFLRRDAISSLPACELGFVEPPGGRPPGVRDSARDTLAYLFASFLTEMPGPTVPSDHDSVVEVRDLVSRPRPVGVALDPEAPPIERASAVLDELEAWHVAEGEREDALEARLERVRLFAARWPEARTALLEDLRARLPAFREVPWYAMGMVEAAFLASPDAEPPDDARSLVEEAIRAFPASLGAERARQMAHVLDLQELDPEVSAEIRVGADGTPFLAVAHRGSATLLLRAYPADLRDLTGSMSGTPVLPDRRTSPAGLAANVSRAGGRGPAEPERRPVAEWSVELRGSGERTTKLPLPAGRFRVEARLAEPGAPTSWFLVPSRVRILVANDPGSPEGIVVRVLSPDGEPVPGAAVHLVSRSLEPSGASPSTTDAEGVARLRRPAGPSDVTYVVARAGGDLELTAVPSVPQVPPVPRGEAAASPSLRAGVGRPAEHSLWLDLQAQTPAERATGVRRVVGRVIPAPGGAFRAMSIRWRRLEWRAPSRPLPAGFVSYPRHDRRVVAAGRARPRKGGWFELELGNLGRRDGLLEVEARDERGRTISGSLDLPDASHDEGSAWFVLDAPRVVHGASGARVRVWRFPRPGSRSGKSLVKVRRTCRDGGGDEVFRVELAHDGRGLATFRLPPLAAGTYAILAQDQGREGSTGAFARSLTVVNEDSPGPEPGSAGPWSELSLWATSDARTGLAYLGWSGQGPVHVDVAEPEAPLRTLLLVGSGGRRLEVAPGSLVRAHLARRGAVETAEVVVPAANPWSGEEKGELEVSMTGGSSPRVLELLVRAGGDPVDGATVWVNLLDPGSRQRMEPEVRAGRSEWVAGSTSGAFAAAAAAASNRTRIYPASWVRWPGARVFRFSESPKQLYRTARVARLATERIGVLDGSSGSLGSCLVLPAPPVRPSLASGEGRENPWTPSGFLRLRSLPLPALNRSPLAFRLTTDAGGRALVPLREGVGPHRFLSAVAVDRQGRMGSLERLVSAGPPRS